MGFNYYGIVQLNIVIAKKHHYIKEVKKGEGLAEVMWLELTDWIRWTRSLNSQSKAQPDESGRHTSGGHKQFGFMLPASNKSNAMDKTSGMITKSMQRESYLEQSGWSKLPFQPLQV